MISNSKRSNLQQGIADLSSVEKIFAEVEAKLGKLELDTEEIITAAINADNQSEQIGESVAALCKLVDSLRTYNARICDLKKTLKEVSNLL